MPTSIMLTVLINALVLSSMYILAALGFAFIFNMLSTVNLAHGSLYMLGAYLCYYLCNTAGLNNWAALIVSAIALAILGFLIERFCFRPFMEDFSRIIMIGVALMTVLQTAATVISGTQTLSTPSFAEGTSILLGISVSNEKILTFTVGVALLAVTLIVVYATPLGHQMEAVSQDRLGAALQGIQINRVSGLVCAFGCALCAVSGGLMGAYQSLSPYMGDNMQMRILMIVMLAGAGSMSGVLITGAVMGFVDSIFPLLFHGYAADAAAAIIIIILLLIKPKGFFGHEM